jgi:hypothetical protein
MNIMIDLIMFAIFDYLLHFSKLFGSWTRCIQGRPPSTLQQSAVKAATETLTKAATRVSIGGSGHVDCRLFGEDL